MAIAANLSVALALNSARYRQGLDQARARTQRFERGIGGSLSRAQQRFRSLTSGVLALGAALGIQQVLTTTDNLIKLSDAVGGNFEQFQRLAFAYGQTGLEANQLARALTTVAGFVVDLEDETQTAVRAFDRLGLSLNDLQGLGIEDQFRLITDRLRGVEDTSIRAAVAADIFGNRLSVSLGQALNSTSADLDEVAQGFTTISETDGRGIEAFNDTLQRLGRQLLSLATQFAPLLNGIGSFVNIIVSLTQAIPGLTNLIGIGLIAVVGVRLGQAFSGAGVAVTRAAFRLARFASTSNIAAASTASAAVAANILASSLWESWLQ